jgi:hypothetical protein
MLLPFTPIIASSLRGMGFTGRSARRRDVVTRPPGWRVHPTPSPVSAATAWAPRGRLSPSG